MITITIPTKVNEFTRRIQTLVDHANSLTRASEVGDIAWVKHHLSKASETVVAIEDAWNASQKNESPRKREVLTAEGTLPEIYWKDQECEDA